MPPQKLTGFKNTMRRITLYDNVTRGLILAAVIGIFGVASGGLTVSPINIRNIFWLASVKGIAAIGQFFAMLVGGIDLSIGALTIMTMGMGAVLLTGKTIGQIQAQEPMAIGLVVVVMIAACIGWGALNGMLWTRAGISPLIIGLGMWQIALGIGFLFIGGRSVIGLPQQFSWLGQGMLAGAFTNSIAFFIVIAVIAYFVLYYTPFGHSCHAVGGNETSAYLTGINVKKIRLQAYMLMGLLTGIGSLAILSRNMSTSIWSIPNLEFDTITAVFIGGMTIGGSGGSLIGTIIGILIVGVVENAMNLMGIDIAEVAIIKGSILAAAVAIAYIRNPKQE